MSTDRKVCRTATDEALRGRTAVSLKRQQQRGGRHNHGYEPALSSRDPPCATHSHRTEASSANGRAGQYSGIRSQQPPGGHSNVFDHHTYASADQGLSTRRASDRRGTTRDKHNYRPQPFPGPPTLGKSTLARHTLLLF
jgi:hypothetical protein